MSDTTEDNTSDDSNELAQQLQQMHQDSLEAKETAKAATQKLEALSQVFNGTKEQEIDPEEWSNDILKDLMEAEKQGQKLPVSSKMFKQLYNISKESLESTKMLKELREQVKSLSNPVTMVDRNTYAVIDEKIHTSLEALYGDSNPVVADAIRAEMVETIKLIQREEPAKWEQIRRNPKFIENLVNHTVKQIMPPEYTKRMAEEEESNKPVTAETIRQAYHYIKHDPEFRKLPAEERQRQQREVRHAEIEFLENQRRRR